ncbi:DKNYY domain-containing protein [Cellulophaga sp. 20_2_10]|uniref:DKNYY domain-containing protein n=1 Tax=Cellulophaga sp. 20_2_10 TaxID=2942476 RepID=UPI00201B07CC|nr:DKNYY domain-containing protein [Cellulophaga sp. 20_2_10]MCL5246631.1 DKNYY domain-containing protein [Cellulophaga sp. 20_2_10]
MKKDFKYILYFLVFTLLSYGQNKTKDDAAYKDSISNKRTKRINYRKNKIDSLNTTLNWRKFKSNLWINKNGELGIKTQEATLEGININRYITKVCCEGESLKTTVDTASFQFLGSSFYKDKNHIYTHYSMSDGGNFWIVEEADVATFKILGDCYAKDKNHIFGERAMVMDNVDYNSFKTKKGIGCFAKDKNGFYFWDDKIDTTNVSDIFVKQKIAELKKL